MHFGQRFRDLPISARKKKQRVHLLHLKSHWHIHRVQLYMYHHVSRFRIWPRLSHSYLGVPICPTWGLKHGHDFRSIWFFWTEITVSLFDGIRPNWTFTAIHLTCLQQPLEIVQYCTVPEKLIGEPLTVAAFTVNNTTHLGIGLQSCSTIIPIPRL